MSHAIAIPDYQPIPVKFRRLRWRFEFHNNKKPRVGIWDGTSKLDSDSAWAVNKDGLSKVIIESEDRWGFTQVMAVVDGVDYVSMQWESYAKSPSLGLKKDFVGEVRLRSHIIGLSILTRTKKITCWCNGTVTEKPLKEHDMRWDIHEHKLEV